MVYSKKKTMLLTLSILASLTVPTYAADTDNADKDVVQAPDVIVTATRTEALVKDIPNTVEVITSEDIKKNGATDIYSALRLADNINILNDGTGMSKKISIRGMDTNQSLILINGRRIAGEDTPTLQNGATLGRINLSNVERIEIIRGAASAQYGSDALSGVINIITKKSTSSQPTVTVGANTGNESMNNYYHIDFGKQGNFSGTLDMNFGKDRERMLQGDDMGYLYGPKQNYNFSGTWDVAKDRSLTFDASYYKARQEADWPSMEGMAQGMNSAFDNMAQQGMPAFVANMLKKKYNNYLSQVDYTKAKVDTTQKDFALTYDGKTDNSNFSFRTYYTRLDKSRFLPYTAILNAFNSAMSGTTPDMGSEDNRYTIWGVDGKDTVQLNDDHLLTFGGEFNKSTVEGDNIGGTQNSKDTTTYAGYIQDEWMINDKLLLIPAVRYDHHSDFGSKTTPKIGATYFLNDNSRIKANWGKGFKAPTVTDLYSDYYHAGTYIYGNPDLQPEESTSWDIGYEAEKNGTFGKITYFRNDVDNMISTQEISKSVEKYYNIPGTTKTDGVEFTLGRHFNDNWTVKLNSNWVNADNSTKSVGTGNGGHSVDGIADNVTTLELNYDDNDPNGYSVSLWNQWYTGYYDSSTDKDYTYNTTNLVINKKFGEGNRIYAGLDNIFDKKVADINLDGRIWRVGAELTFN